MYILSAPIMKTWIIALSCAATLASLIYTNDSLSKSPFGPRSSLTLAALAACVATVPSTWAVLLTSKLFIPGVLWGAWQEPRVALASVCFLRARTLHAILAHAEPAFLTHRGLLVRDNVRSDLLRLCGTYLRAYVAWEIAAVLICGGPLAIPLAIAVYSGRDTTLAVSDNDIADFEARTCRACAPSIRAPCCSKHSTP